MTTAKIIEITAESPESFDHAIRTGLDKAKATVKNIQGAWIKDQEIKFKDGKIDRFRVNMKVTFILD